MSKRLYKFKIKRVEVADLNVEIESGLKVDDTISSVMSTIKKDKHKLAFSPVNSIVYMESFTSEPIKEEANDKH